MANNLGAISGRKLPLVELVILMQLKILYLFMHLRSGLSRMITRFPDSLLISDLTFASETLILAGLNNDGSSSDELNSDPLKRRFFIRKTYLVK